MTFLSSVFWGGYKPAMSLKNFAELLEPIVEKSYPELKDEWIHDLMLYAVM
jgi:hypothetical protein